MSIQDDISVIILSSGNSTRMNTPKAFLMFDNSKTFLEKIIETYIESGILNIILVVNPGLYGRASSMLSKYKVRSNVKLIPNRFSDLGRFYSIRLGLFNCDTPHTFLQNIDNPFISANLIEEMTRLSSNSNYVVPAYKNQEAHPILISKKIIDSIVTTKGVNYHLKTMLQSFPKSVLDWNDKNILLNINTVDEYRKYVIECSTFINF